MATPKLDQVVAKGNRGHAGYPDSHITCADGFKLSVIAGGGTYCTPRPAFCSHYFDKTAPISMPTGSYEPVPCDYPGPYSAVEVMFLEEGEYPESWGADDSVAGRVPVELVREFIESHGGEA